MARVRVAVTTLCRRTATITDDDELAAEGDEALDGEELDGEEMVPAGTVPADRCSDGLAARIAADNPSSSGESVNTRPLESRSRLMRCKSVRISAACW